MFQGQVVAACLDTFRNGVGSTYQPAGTSCSQGRTVPSQPWGHGQATPGQYHGMQLHTAARWDKESLPVQGGMSVVDTGPVQQHHAPHPPLALIKRQCRGRLPDQKQTESMGVQVGPGLVSADPGNFSSFPNPGCFRIHGHSSAAQVHDMVSRHGSSCSGCSSSQVGSCNVSLSSGTSHAESSSEGQRSEDQGSVGVPALANINVVATGPGHDGGTSSTTPILPASSGNSRRGSSPAIHGATSSHSPFRQQYVLSHAASGLDSDDLDFLSNHLASSTRSGYGYAFQQFSIFCDGLGVDPLKCGPTILVKYIRQMYDSGAEYSTINHHRSSIAKFHIGFGGVSIGCHPMVSQAVKAVFRLRPPLPKYVATFDISKVFGFLKTWPMNTDLSLKQLSFKTLFLLTAASISRLSSVGRLGPDLQVYEVSKFFDQYFTYFTYLFFSGSLYFEFCCPGETGTSWSCEGLPFCPEVF